MAHNLEQILKRSVVAVGAVLVLSTYSVFGLYGCGGCGPKKWENVVCPNSDTKREVMYDINDDGELGWLEYNAYCYQTEPRAAEKGAPGEPGSNKRATGKEGQSEGESAEKAGITGDGSNNYAGGFSYSGEENSDSYRRENGNRKCCKKPRTCPQNRGGNATLGHEQNTPPHSDDGESHIRSRFEVFRGRQ